MAISCFQSSSCLAKIFFITCFSFSVCRLCPGQMTGSWFGSKEEKKEEEKKEEDAEADGSAEPSTK